MIELDKRILPGKKPLTCFDTKQAQNFVGKKCYLTNDISIFSDLDSFKETEGCSDALYVGVIDRLTNINKELSMVFDTTFLRWKFCIPCEWVKPEEHEEIYRAFSLNEFSELYAIGDVVTFRLKDCEVIEQSMLIGFQSSHDEDIPGNGFVLIGNCRYGFMELFNNYELKYLNHWQPFGIEVEENEE